METKGHNKYWGLMIDQASKRKWSIFGNTKPSLCEGFIKIIRKLKGQGYPVKYIRMDNGGEWKFLKEGICVELGITIELTAPNTPSLNGEVERSFPSLRNKAQVGSQLQHFLALQPALVSRAKAALHCSDSLTLRKP